jgi:hypothetical protein
MIIYNGTMNKLKIYVETSVWNFIFADDAPEKMESTIRFFSPEEICRYDIYISETVIAEIADAPDTKRELLLGAMEKHHPDFLNIDMEVRSLAASYLDYGLLTPKQSNDLLHLAFATVNGIDILLTWNMKHLLKRKTQLIVEATNRLLGYRGLEIRSPEEMMENEV